MAKFDTRKNNRGYTPLKNGKSRKALSTRAQRAERHAYSDADVRRVLAGAENAR